MPDLLARRLFQLVVAGLLILFLPFQILRPKGNAACLRLGQRIGRVLLLGRLSRIRYDYHQLTWDESLFFVTRGVLQRVFGWQIVTPVLVRDGPALATIAACNGSVIIASPHYPHHADMQMCLDHLAGRKVLVVAYSPETVAASFRQTLPSFREGRQSIVTVEYLKADSNCLARLRSMVAEGWIILCNVDSPEPGGHVCNTVRAGIFRFAERTKTPVFASRYRLLEDASVEVGLVSLPVPATEAAAVFAAHQRPERVFDLEPALRSA